MAMTQDKQPEYHHWQPTEVKIINDRATRFRDVCVHEIRVGDVEDPDIYVAEPIWQWQESDAGKFVMEHAVDKPYWTRTMDLASYGHMYRIMARLSEPNELFWRLRWDGIK